ncbi:hypothetical protein [Bradyrhizobium sp. SRS-191]|uniref:hypothetical protein n=1 Tax=Bradyrhizobium sp. SRS-191 TaxID=2962606 RepID=UPI00211E3651|nr:hypothetical protein [Bradyrhizobium sp. SRS-191]
MRQLLALLLTSIVLLPPSVQAANVNISDLAAATAAGADLIECQKGGINKQCTAADVANTANALNASAITGGTLSASRGGIGTTNGIVKGDGAGNASAAVAATDYVKPGASLQATPTNPTGTGGTVMMGLGATCKITPSASGRVMVSFNFVNANTGVFTNTAQIKYGTGTAPSNNVASTGTSLGTQKAVYEPVATASLPVSMSGYVLTGLTVGTQYWFDVLFGTGGGTATMTSVDCSLMEF